MNYAYELKKCKDEFYTFNNIISNHYIDKFGDLDIEFCTRYRHIAERCLDRNINQKLIIKLVLYVLSSYKNDIFYNSTGEDICINYRDDIQIIIKHDVSDGRFQKKHEIRLATVLLDNQPTKNAKYFYVGIQEMMGYKLPQKTSNYIKEFNYDERFKSATNRLNVLIDSL